MTGVQRSGNRRERAVADRRAAWSQLVQRWSWHDTTALLHQLWVRQRQRARDSNDHQRARRRLNFTVAVLRLRADSPEKGRIGPGDGQVPAE